MSSTSIIKNNYELWISCITPVSGVGGIVAQSDPASNAQKWPHQAPRKRRREFSHPAGITPPARPISHPRPTPEAATAKYQGIAR
jgi:hypothetical protein